MRKAERHASDVFLGLIFDSRKGMAGGLGLDRADRLAVNKQRVIRLAGLEGKLAHRDAARGGEIHRVPVLNDPTARAEESVDFLSCQLHGIGHRRIGRSRSQVPFAPGAWETCRLKFSAVYWKTRASDKRWTWKAVIGGRGRERATVVFGGEFTVFLDGGACGAEETTRTKLIGAYFMTQRRDRHKNFRGIP